MSMANYFRIFMTSLLLLCISKEAATLGSEAKPDLWVYSGDLSFKGEGTRYIGYSYIVNFRVYNSGNRDLTYNDTFAIGFFLTKEPGIFTSYCVSLGIYSFSLFLRSSSSSPSDILSQKVTIPDTLSLDETRSFYLTLVLDTYENIDELYENDNIISSKGQYTISEPPQGIDLTGKDVSFDESFYGIMGSSYTLSYTLMNQGSLDYSGAAPMTLKYYLSLNNIISPLDIPIGDIHINATIPKRSSIEKLESVVMIPGEIQAGVYYLVSCPINNLQKLFFCLILFIWVAPLPV